MSPLYTIICQYRYASRGWSAGVAKLQIDLADQPGRGLLDLGLPAALATSGNDSVAETVQLLVSQIQTVKSTCRELDGARQFFGRRFFLQNVIGFLTQLSFDASIVERKYLPLFRRGHPQL